jgi:hypothetical protein
VGNLGRKAAQATFGLELSTVYGRLTGSGRDKVLAAMSYKEWLDWGIYAREHSEKGNKLPTAGCMQQAAAGSTKSSDQ